MNIFLKIGEKLFMLLAIFLIAIALILENISNMSKITKKECNQITNKTNPMITHFKQTQIH